MGVVSCSSPLSSTFTSSAMASVSSVLCLVIVVAAMAAAREQTYCERRVAGGKGWECDPADGTWAAVQCKRFKGNRCFCGWHYEPNRVDKNGQQWVWFQHTSDKAAAALAFCKCAIADTESGQLYPQVSREECAKQAGFQAVWTKPAWQDTL